MSLNIFRNQYYSLFYKKIMVMMLFDIFYTNYL